MNIQVMSRKQFIEYQNESHRMSSFVISISSLDESRPDMVKNNSIGNQIKGILYLHFNDTDNPKDSIQDNQAFKIAIALNDNINKVDKIIVHCGAGQSRSSGVAGAILKYYTNDDSLIFNNRRYTPNMYCYRKVLEWLYKYNDEVRS